MTTVTNQSSECASERPAAEDWSRLVTLLGARRHAELEQTARTLLSRQPRVGAYWKVLGAALWLQGKDPLESLQKAAELLPDDAEAHSNLGNALRARKQLEAAAASHRRALAIHPRYADAHINLGTVLRDLGRAEEAVPCFHRALELDPRSALAQHNLGIALASLGRMDEAVMSFVRAIELKPDFVESYTSLGHALQETGQHESAAASFRRAVELKPDLAEAHFGLGNAMFELGHLTEAEAHHRRALVLKPDYAEAHSHLAIALDQQGRGAEALQSCRRALALKPDSVSAVMVLAQLTAHAGDFVEAEKLLREAIARSPDLPEAWSRIAGLRRMSTADADWLSNTLRIAARPLTPRRESLLRFALGKYYDDVGDYARAFENYRAANDLSKRYGAEYDRQQVEDIATRVIQRYDRNWLARPRPGASTSARPVFIVGMPRSGTTLAEQILASHPAVFGAGELPFWSAASARHLAAMTDPARSEQLLGALAEEYLQVLERRSSGALRVTDKLPLNFSCLGLLHAAFPNARIIHLKRDPIDTCLSIYFQDFQTAHSFANDLQHLAHYYGEYRRLLDHWRAVLPANVLFDLPYEGLVADQEGWTRKMLEFLDLPWDPACLEFHRTARNISTFSKWQARQKITRTSVQRWRNYEAHIGPLASLAGSNESSS